MPVLSSARAAVPIPVAIELIVVRLYVVVTASVNPVMFPSVLPLTALLATYTRSVPAKMADGPVPPVEYGEPLISLIAEEAPIVNTRKPPVCVPLTAAVSPTYSSRLPGSTATAFAPPAEFTNLIVPTAPNGLVVDVVFDAVKGTTAVPPDPMAINT